MIYPQFCMQEISCLTEIFKWYDKETTVFSSSLKPVNSEDGFTFLPHKTFDEFQRENLIVLFSLEFGISEKR